MRPGDYTVATIGDRRVPVPRDPDAPVSLYALCRAWVRNNPALPLTLADPNAPSSEAKGDAEGSQAHGLVNILPPPLPPTNLETDTRPPDYVEDTPPANPEESLRKLKEHWVAVRQYQQSLRQAKLSRYRERLQLLLGEPSALHVGMGGAGVGMGPGMGAGLGPVPPPQLQMPQGLDPQQAAAAAVAQLQAMAAAGGAQPGMPPLGGPPGGLPLQLQQAAAAAAAMGPGAAVPGLAGELGQGQGQGQDPAQALAAMAGLDPSLLGALPLGAGGGVPGLEGLPGAGAGLGPAAAAAASGLFGAPGGTLEQQQAALTALLTQLAGQQAGDAAGGAAATGLLGAGLLPGLGLGMPGLPPGGVLGPPGQQEAAQPQPQEVKDQQQQQQQQPQHQGGDGAQGEGDKAPGDGAQPTQLQVPQAPLPLPPPLPPAAQPVEALMALHQQLLQLQGFALPGMGPPLGLPLAAGLLGQLVPGQGAPLPGQLQQQQQLSEAMATLAAAGGAPVPDGGFMAAGLAGLGALGGMGLGTGMVADGAAGGGPTGMVGLIGPGAGAGELGDGVVAAGGEPPAGAVSSMDVDSGAGTTEAGA